MFVQMFLSLTDVVRGLVSHRSSLALPYIVHHDRCPGLVRGRALRLENARARKNKAVHICAPLGFVLPINPRAEGAPAP